MASTGERLVSWQPRVRPIRSTASCIDGMMQKWQAVYADQLGLVDSGLTTSMWQAPGLVRTSPSPRREPSA
jgi:autoinducer 2 (AI-2) kinase